MDIAQPRNRRYIAILAAVACFILIVGLLLRPRDIPQSPPPVASETELQELARRAQRRSLESMTAYFGELAAQVRPSLAYITSAGMSAIIWDDRHIITGRIRSADEAAVATVRTASAEARADATSSARLPLSVLEVRPGPSSAMIPKRAASHPQAGDWIAAVWQTENAPAFAAGNFFQSAATRCGAVTVRTIASSVLLSPHMIGGGLFNLDRELLGVILPCGDRVVAVAPSGVDEMLTRVTTIEERLLTTYGVLFGDLSGHEQQYFKDVGGLFVREVWIDTSADAAGFRAGDLVMALNAEPVNTIDDLRPLANPADGPFSLRVQRGRNSETLTLDSGSAPAAPASDRQTLGLSVGSSTPAYRIDAVAPGSRAARAGLEPGDRLLRINGSEPRNPDEMERMIAAPSSTPVMLEVERDARRIALVIPGSTAP